MDNSKQLSVRIDHLQRRVRLLTGALVATIAFLALLVTMTSWPMKRNSETIRAQRVKADILEAGLIVVRNSQPDTDRIVLGAGKAGAHVFLQDPAGNNRVLLNGKGLDIADTSGKHAIVLRLSPGPGDLRAPFMLLRDRAGQQRFSISLNAENDTPHIRLDGTDANEFVEVSSDAVMLYNSDGRIHLHNELDSVPYVEVRGAIDGDSQEWTKISPETRMESESSEDER